MFCTCLAPGITVLLDHFQPDQAPGSHQAVRKSGGQLVQRLRDNKEGPDKWWKPISARAVGEATPRKPRVNDKVVREMIDRFEGDAGRKTLLKALADQRMVAGNTALAEEIVASGELMEVKAGTAIIEQGNDDKDVYLIVAGCFDIVVNGRAVARRFPNDHVGEMVAIQPTQRRSASLVAHEPSVVVKLSEPRIAALGDRFPQIWRCFARELAHRVEQRNALAAAVSEQVRVLIVASTEATDIARAIQNAFDQDPFNVVIWTEGVFRSSHYSIESLERALDQTDVAIAVVEPDDHTESRGERRPAPRDKLIFELGFFMGRLGRHRALLVEPRGEEIRLPSDMAGINAVTYKYDARDLPGSVTPACHKLRTLIRDLGPHR
jgi:predicted nucleotide-binding protein